MLRPKFFMISLVSLAYFWGGMNISYATIRLAKGHFANAHFGGGWVDPCLGKSIGQACTDGATYAGTGYSAGGLNSALRYEVAPGHCTDYANNNTSFSPTCSGATDSIQHAWANNSGTTAYEVDTGVTDANSGSSNTTTLAANYTDTDAARYCHYMDYAGHTDWYLPAKDELNTVLYANRAALGGFVSSYYWSSTQNGVTYAWIQYFLNGNQSNSVKTNALYFRCVRSY